MQSIENKCFACTSLKNKELQQRFGRRSNGRRQSGGEKLAQTYIPQLQQADRAGAGGGIEQSNRRSMPEG